jgi:dTDP-glucose 4,6-dehydratase
VSTDEIYGEAINKSFKENNAPNPSNPYSASKAAADMFVISYHKTFNLDVVITRCTNNYGPYQFPEKLVPKTIIRIIKGLPVILYGSGMDVRDWLYVTDHCEAIAVALKKGKSGEIYNISSKNELTNIKLVKKLLSLMKASEDLITHVENRPGHDQRYSLDSSKIRTKLGWTPQYSLDQKLKDTVDWYINNKWWWSPLITPEILHPTPWKLRETS